MNSINALKSKIDELHKQAEEIEELGVKLLEEAPFEAQTENGGIYYLFNLDYNSPLRKVQHEAILKYRQWYSTGLQLIDRYFTEWVYEYKNCYDDDNSRYNGLKDYLRLGCYSNYTSRELMISDFVSKLETQLSILLSIPPVIEVKEIDAIPIIVY
jgi:hypothetical protein